LIFSAFLQQIDKAANALKNSVEQFRIFINGMDRWVANNRERALQIFRTFDVNSTGKITHDQFKAGIAIAYYVPNISFLYILMFGIITGFVIYLKILPFCWESFFYYLLKLLILEFLLFNLKLKMCHVKVLSQHAYWHSCSVLEVQNWDVICFHSVAVVCVLFCLLGFFTFVEQINQSVNQPINQPASVVE